jgi:hypothetical protein
MTDGLAILGGWIQLAILLALLLWIVLHSSRT